MKGFVTSALLAAASAAFAQTPAPLTVTGCLTSARNNFTLTVTDPQQPGATTPTTTTYSLIPPTGVDLKGHVNHKVEVKGTEQSGQAQAAVVDSSRSQETPTAGTSGSAGGNRPTPTVETTAKAQIVAKTLSVESVKMVADRCDGTR